MAKNYVSSGESWTGAAPVAVFSGDTVVLGVQIGIAQEDAALGEECSFSLAGVWTLPSSGEAHDVGQPLNYDVEGGTFYAGEATTEGDLANCGMSFSPGGGSLEFVNVKLNTHLGEFVTA